MTPFPSHSSIRLLSSGAILLTQTNTLVVADVHLGKSATFRARGFPIPEGDNSLDFARLLTLATDHQAQHLVVAGDLFHATAGITRELEKAMSRFISALSIPLTLVAGNHDSRIPRLPGGFECSTTFDPLRGVRIVHDPEHASDEDVLHIAGHWHPIVRIPDGRRTSLRLPCFLQRGNVLVLPAFGSFTGGAIIRPQTGDRVFVGHQGQVIELPAELLGRGIRPTI